MDSTSSDDSETPSQPSPVRYDDAKPQVYVITPNQLAKLGLTTQIHSLIATQAQSKRTAAQVQQSITLDNVEKQTDTFLSTSSHLEEDKKSSSLTENEINNQIRVSMNAENAPTTLRNEMKSKLYHLLNTDESNANTSAIKDSNKIQILNYTTPTPSLMFDTMNSTTADKRNILDSNVEIFSPGVNIIIKREMPVSADGTGVGHNKILTKSLNYDCSAKQRIVKSVPRIITSKPFSTSEATKTTPKLEIVSNEVVNFSPLEIRNILKQKSKQSKVTQSIPQSTKNTIINKTAYLRNQDGATMEKHFKKKLYESFHVADNATVEKQSSDIDDKVIDLDNKPEECSDSINQRVIKNDFVNQPKVQTLKLYSRTKDKNTFLPPAKTYVVREAQIQILSSPETPTEQVRPEYRNEEKSIPDKQEAQIDSKHTTSIETLKRDDKKATVPINNNTEPKAAKNKGSQKLTSPTLLNSLLQKVTSIDIFSTNSTDHTSLNLLNRGIKVQKKQSEVDIDSVKENNSEEQTKEINIAPEVYKENIKTVDKNSINEQENFTLEATLFINNSQIEQVKKVEKTPPPRILNLELQDKKEVSLEVEKRQHKSNLKSASKKDSEEQINEINLTSEFPEKPASTDIVDKNSNNKQESEILTSEKTSLNSQTEQEEKIKKTPASLPRVLNLELQERKKIITDKSGDSKKENLQTSKEKVDGSGKKQKSSAASVVQSPKLHQDLLKKVNILAAQPNPTKSNTTEEIEYKLHSITGKDIWCYRNNKNVNSVKSDDSSLEISSLEFSSLEFDTDSDEVTSDEVTSDVEPITLKKFLKRNKIATYLHRTKPKFSGLTSPKFKYRKCVGEVNTSATLEKTRTLRTSEKKKPTLRTSEKKTRTLRTFENSSDSDIDLYVQSKTSGRKRKYVDYKVLSGISKYNYSDNDLADEDVPLKIIATEKSTDLNDQDKSTKEIPVKRGRGRPKKTEIKSNECGKQLKLEASKCLLNSVTEIKCNSPAVVDNSAQSERNLPRASLIISPSEKKLRDRKRKSTVEKTEASEGTPKRKRTPTLLRKPTMESEHTEKMLRSGSKVFSEKINSANESPETPQKNEETKASPQNSNSKQDIFLESANTADNDSELIKKKRRGRPKKQVEDDDINSMNNKKDPEPVDTESERKDTGRLREPIELTDDKTQNSKNVLPQNITINDDKIDVKRRRGRPKKINNKSQSAENKTEFNESETSKGNDQTESKLNRNSLNYTKDSPSDISEEIGKPTEKKRRGRPKKVINESKRETEQDLQNKNVDSFTKSEFVKKEENTYNVELKKELEAAGVAVQPQKRRGRKRKIVVIAKTLEESNNVTCAVCKLVIDESQWGNHNEIKHNNLAWKTDEDPLDLNDQVLVERILSKLYESKKLLHCELCECEIQTLPDYAEHKKTCTQKSDDTVKLAAKNTLVSSVLDSLFANIPTPTKPAEPVSTESTSAIEEIKDSSLVEEEILPPLGANDIRCAVCKNVMPKGQWPSHKQKKHNNLAWKVGEKPLDLNDRSLVMRTLTDLCKSKKYLFCEICGVSKKSALGYLSHKSQCQKSDSEIDALKVTCKLCGRLMLPVSLQRHMALTHTVTVMEIDSLSPERIVSESDPQGKRKAANKAAGLIHSFAKDILNEIGSAKFKKYVKNVNFRSVEAAICKFSEDIQKQSYTECVFGECNYRTSEHEDLFYHIENCDKNSDTNYTCNFCLATFRARQSVRDHIKLIHSNNENRYLISQFSDDEFNSESEDDYENDYISDSELIHTGAENSTFLNTDPFSVTRSRKTQALSSGESSNHRIHFLQKRTKKPQSIYLNAYWWMKKFCQENYKLQNSFPRNYCKKEDWIQIDPKQITNYLPKLRYSVDTARISINNIVNPICYEYVWKKYKLFESEALSNDGSSIFFCGGPINALAWVPTPHTETKCDQILAVSVAPDPDVKYNTNSVYKDAGLIQFWNIGVLHNRGISTCQPKLEFSIAHHYGVIWAMEWCPSGYYDLITTNNIRRLGLLAIACSNSFVYIYLVPHPGQISGKIFRTKPVYKLQLENFTDLTVGEIDYYSTRLSWCKTYGHQFLAVGYSNGVVAIYDLKTEASLLKMESDDIITMKPIQKFRPHLDAITALCMYHLHNGKRWLLTGSLDRDCKLWDLENISEPIHYCKKFIITDAVWLIHWLCSIYSYDHGSISGAVPTSLNPARDFLASCTSFMPSNSRVASITANEWANLFIQANDCGEVICGFPDQLLQGYDCDKKKSIRKSRCLASYTGMVPKSIPSSERIRLEAAKLETLKNRHSNSSADKSSKKQSIHHDVNDGSYEARTYFEAEEKYGLVFCDLKMDCKSKEPTVELDKLLQSTHYFSLAKPDVYPLQSITKVSSNPNKNSCLYYACGYQVGIIRVSNLKFLGLESEQNGLLR